MAEGPYLMGIDFGTGGVRVGREYGFYVDRYSELYPATLDVMHKVTGHVAGSAGTADG